MPDDPTDTRAQRMPGGGPASEGLADTPRDTTAGAMEPQDGPMDRSGMEAADDAGAPMTNEPIPVGEDEPGVGMTERPEPDIEGSRGM